MKLLREKPGGRIGIIKNAAPYPLLVPAPKSAPARGSGIKCHSHFSGFSECYFIWLGVQRQLFQILGVIGCEV